MSEIKQGLEIENDSTKLEYILRNLDKDILHDESNKKNRDELIEEIILAISPTWYVFRILDEKDIKELIKQKDRDPYKRLHEIKENMGGNKINNFSEKQIQDLYIKNNLKIILTCCLINREKFLKEKYTYLNTKEI